MQFNKISLQFLNADYEKVAYLLPIPTYRRTLTKTNHQGYVIITYELKHAVTSVNQFRWLCNIKYSIKKHIKVNFEFVEYLQSANQENTNNKYSFQELQEYFKPIKFDYPKIYLPSNKKEVYQRLCIYAKKLHFQNIFYLELIIIASMKMNEILDNPLTYKELLSKSKNAYDLVAKTKPKQKLNNEELKTALRSGGNKRAKQMKQKQQQNQEQIKELLKDEVFIKANGKPNITAIADRLKVDRKTITRNIKSLLCIFPFFFLLSITPSIRII